MNPLALAAINSIRSLSIDAVQKANSGHPGLPLGAAPMAYVLWQRHLKHSPRNPKWADRDRFVLSAGHGCMIHYALLHLTGYDLTLDDLKAFRQWGSRTPGHPETFVTPGVEATTGPLGPGDGQRGRHGHRRAVPGQPLQPPRPHHRRPPHLRPGLRRRPDGGPLARGRLAGRAPQAGQAHLPLRRQQDLARRPHLAGLHRGRGQALRGLRLARAAGGERQRGHRGHRPRPRRRPGPRPSARRSSSCAPPSATARPTRPTPPRCTAARWASRRSS